MCGIVAYIGEHQAYNIIVDGLVQLQNRGYDSAGISHLDNSKNCIRVHKYASDENKTALDALRETSELHTSEFHLGLGHTRWATHGPKNNVNAHPHQSNDNIFSIVHNGIIENYLEIKNKLKKNGYFFVSDTDTEIIVNLLSFYYDIHLDVIKSIECVINELEGTWGVAIISCRFPNNIFTFCHGSPIVIGFDDHNAIICSEQSAMCGNFEKYFILENDDICVIQRLPHKISIQTNHVYKINTSFKGQLCVDTPHPYPHWTIAEIHQQVNSSKLAMGNGGRIRGNVVVLGGLEQHAEDLIDIEHIIFLGCGTSYFSSFYVSHLFKKICTFTTIQCIDGAEFSEYDIPKTGKIGCIFITQSGETRDLHRCIQIIDSSTFSVMKIGVINVVDSQIAREMDCGCYLNAGKEFAVASTKSFTSQVIVLTLIGLWFSQKQNVDFSIREKYIQDIKTIPIEIETLLKDQTVLDQIQNAVNILKFKKHCFVLGKNQCESVAKEGSLKLKEITYIHAEGYSTSSLKHGPFALLEEGFPVFLFCLKDEHYEKALNAYEQMKSRFAEIIIITNDPQLKMRNCIYLPTTNMFSSLLGVLPLQLIAYHLSVARGLNPDMPRNLAKVVTVE